MNIDLLVVGKTDSAEIQSLVATYLKRLNFYTRVTLVTLPKTRCLKRKPTAFVSTRLRNTSWI